MPVPHKAALLGAVALLLLLEGCGNKEIPPPAGTKPTTVSKATEQRAEGVPVPAEEPSEDDLRKLGVDTVIITGFCAEFCVLAAYRGAEDRDLTPILLRGALASATPENIRFVENISSIISYGALKKVLE